MARAHEGQASRRSCAFTCGQSVPVAVAEEQRRVAFVHSMLERSDTVGGYGDVGRDRGAAARILAPNSALTAMPRAGTAEGGGRLTVVIAR